MGRPEPPDQPILLSVVVPAYNEAGKIGRDLEVLYHYLAHQAYRSEVLVVDDGSADRTQEVAAALQGRYAGLQVIRYAQNRGKGYAVKTGVLAARGTYVLFVDAGNCVPYDEIEKALVILCGGKDVAIGSRALARSQLLERQSWVRRVGSRVFGLVVHHLMGIAPIRDTQCGFKMYRQEAARAIFSLSRIDGFMFDVEAILNAKRLGLSLQEFPVAWRNDPDSRFHPLTMSWGLIWQLTRIQFGRWRRL
jgi:dolichyl-phosphate beta-glucosyltransferase